MRVLSNFIMQVCEMWKKNLHEITLNRRDEKKDYSIYEYF